MRTKTKDLYKVLKRRYKLFMAILFFNNKIILKVYIGKVVSIQQMGLNENL